jgi:hypothetical protein
MAPLHRTVATRYIPACLALTLATAAANPAHATILTFDDDLPVSNGELIDENYGDQVVSTTMAGNLLYSVGSEDFTPNVVVDYGPSNANPALSTTGYGNLTNVLFPNAARLGILELTFTADPGHHVQLMSWDMAALTNAFVSKPTINSVKVLDAANSNAELLSLTNVSIAKNAHTPFDFSANPFTSRKLTLRFDSANLGLKAKDIAIDNVTFGQIPVPEPASIAMLALGIGCGLYRRRRPPV